MRELALSALIIAALVAISAIAPADAKAAKKHQQHWRQHTSRARYGHLTAPMVRSYDGSGDVCPAMGRSFDCKIWPPPFADDPDRRVPGRL
jgi:hypothetical protein